ncbi:hypothetical protein HY489_03240 [Candidatus Woesearchaeota archaeon]|nr:hypothetical protein [Candidatus Woesearchaeota archaeon]
MNIPWDIETVKLVPTKHFARDYLQQWGWDTNDLREAIRQAYKIEQCGKTKYELYIQKSGYKKIITAYYDAENKLICISRAEGGKRT